MDADLIWLVVGVVLIVAELFTVTLVLGLIGVGALAAAAVAFAGLGAVAQVLAFGLSTGALLVFVRPPIKNALDRGGTSSRTDPRELQGAQALVVERVSEQTGQVRLSGELWRARPYAGNGPYEVGVLVSVASVEGATVLVFVSDLS